MHITRRHALLALAATPMGCAIQPLTSLATQDMAAPDVAKVVRPPQVGQSWTYQKRNHFNGELLPHVREWVVAVGAGIEVHRQEAGGTPLPHELHSTWGQLLRDPVWDYPLNLEKAVPLWPASLVPGHRTSLHTHYLEDGGSYRHWVQVYTTVTRWERVTLPVGTFDTARVERLLRLSHHDHTRVDTLRLDVLWLAPNLGRWVARETSGRYRIPDGDGRGSEYLEDHFHWELTAWQ